MLVLTLIGVGVSLFLRTVFAPRDVVGAYYQALSDGNSPGAYALLCPAAQDGIEDYTSSVADLGVRRWHSNSVNVESTNGVTRARVVGRVDLADGSTRAVTVILTKPGGTWRVCGGTGVGLP